MKILSLIFIIVLSFISCRTTKTSQPKVLLASTTVYDTVAIASFNIQVFGKTKANKPEVMAFLATIISKFDIVAIQEIEDRSGTAIEKLEAAVDGRGKNYHYIISKRLGRTSSKEQYAYFYNTETIEPVDSYTFDDITHTFHREPFIAYFRVKEENFDFVLINIHTNPDEATEEITALPDVILDAQNHFEEPDIIVLGNFNADCDYFDESTYESIFPPGDYNWLISNNEDTTVRETVCTYDRIVTTDSTDEDYTGSSGVHRFDTRPRLTEEQAVRISDHYPVWAEFWLDKDTD